MWIKNIFKKDSKSLTTEELHKKLKPGENQQDFEEENDLETSNVFIDSTEDTRYTSVKPLSHGPELGIPLNLLHSSQTVLMLMSNSHNSETSNNFYVKTGHDQQFTKLQLLVMTDRQLIISPNPFSKTAFSTGTSLLVVSLGLIEKCQYIPPKKQPARLVLVLKDDKCLQFKSVLADDVKRLEENVRRFAHVQEINKFFAFKLGKENEALVKHKQGWPIYNIQQQFKRQGILIAPCSTPQNADDIDKKYAYRYINNGNFELSPTYPQFLVVPSQISYAEIVKCSKFRTKERLPVLTFAFEYGNKKMSTLFRCSQNKVGMMGTRCKQDQLMMECIGQPVSKPRNSDGGVYKTCKIYDARGYYAALGNMFAGKGYEKEEYYKNCIIQWLNIPNIHAVRDSYNVLRSSDHDRVEFIHTVGLSSWYDYLFLIIAGAKSIAKDLLKGTNCVVHCSDGWDRTSQLCALSQLLLDPYYRTFEGFAVLVQKDWRYFGHKFRQRTGQFHPTNYHPHEKSPIFIQFLDCIYQIMAQFPLSFEFSSKLLLFLANTIYENVFGNFMTNSMQEAGALKIEEMTVSVWAHVFEHKQVFKNPFYIRQLSKGESFLDVSSDVKHMKIWKDHFLGEGSDLGGADIEHEVMQQQSEINRALKQQLFNNDSTIQALKREIQQIKSRKSHPHDSVGNLAI